MFVYTTDHLEIILGLQKYLSFEIHKHCLMFDYDVTEKITRLSTFVRKFHV